MTHRINLILGAEHPLRIGDGLPELQKRGTYLARQLVFRNFEAAAAVFALRTFAALWRVTGVIPNSDANLTIRSNATFDIEIQGL
jgi:hypothetical protein